MKFRGLAIGGAAFLTLGTLAYAGCSGDSSTITPAPDQDAAPDDTATPPKPVCGNGAVEKGEDCDNGAQNAPGSGCERDCSFTCTAGTVNGDPKCDDHNVCNGAETCAADHKCHAGTSLGDGASCGGSKLCNGGVCADAVCGDGFKTPPEECDPGASSDPGCTSCKFTCVSSDTTRNCTPADPCKGQGTCNDATHVCTNGTPLGDGTSCGSGKVCKAGTCIPATCGDGIVESPAEECDFGAANGAGTGCEVTCKFSCEKAPSDTCVTADLCAGTNVCTSNAVSGHAGQKCVRGAPPPNGTPCPNNGKCQGGVCQTALCGNGTLDQGEDCDFGVGNGAGTGCELDCKFSCTKSPNSCPNADPCNAQTQACTNVTGGNGGIGQHCTAGTPLAACASCGTGALCSGGRCGTSICGDGCIDPTKGETCEPPNTSTCDAQCHTIVLAVCGNGTRENGEQCDDGNVINLDGCDSKCQFEQDHRANSVTVQLNTDAFCTVNALGSAITSNAQGQLQTALTNSVKSGATSVMFKFFGLTDLTGGTTQNSIQLGALDGKPVNPAAPYDGSNDPEWWYTTDPLAIDGTRTPKSELAGSIVATILNAAGTLDLTVALGGPTASVLHMSNARLRANIGPANAPTMSSNGSTPGHLASENIDPALRSFATMSNGALCGNISAASLATVPVPNALRSDGDAGAATQCAENYTMNNHLLDVIVHGCKVLGGFITAINPTQPDQSDPGVPAAGAGALYVLSASSAATHVIDTCKDRTGAVVDFTTCKAAAAYSSYLKFTSDRVIAK